MTDNFAMQRFLLNLIALTPPANQLGEACFSCANWGRHELKTQNPKTYGNVINPGFCLLQKNQGFY